MHPRIGGSTFDPSPPCPPHSPGSPRRAVGREGAGQAGISPGSLSWGSSFNWGLPRDQPCPLPGPGPGLCLLRGSGLAPGPLSFIPGQLCLLCVAGPAARRPVLREQWGCSGKAGQAALRGLRPFFAPLCAAPAAASAQTTKAVCLAASVGAPGGQS